MQLSYSEDPDVNTLWLWNPDTDTEEVKQVLYPGLRYRGSKAGSFPGLRFEGCKERESSLPIS